MFLFWRRRRNDPRASDRFGGYQVVKLIHEGRKSTVYQARRDGGPDQFVIKSYNPKFDRDARRMMRKYELRGEGPIGRICNAPAGVDPANHPIVQTVDFGHEFGREDQPHYIVLEYVRGYNLKNLLTTTPESVRKHGVALLPQIVAGLAFMHDRGLLHRDFCADNVMVAPAWRAKIIDFGFACPFGRRFEQRSGTPTYMAPEQFAALPLMAGADIYAFGCVAYEILTGRPPFLSVFSHTDPEVAEKRTMDLMEQHLHKPPPPPRQIAPDMAPAMEKFLLRCLAKKPDDRFESMLALRRALQPIIEKA